MRQQLRALAKLTLSLRVTAVRHDGYHLLDAEMVTLDLADLLTFDDPHAPDERVDEPGDDGEAREGDRVSRVEMVGAALPADDLVGRALRAVGRRATVVIYKSIPLGAGLGGGSADAAAVLRWAGCTDAQVALGLGADVPFCLVGGRARVSGVGEVVEPLPFVDATYTLLTPPLPVPTPAVYRAWDEMGGPRADGPNDLEPAALRVEPRLAEWRDRLGDATGRAPVLAGSGGTWFVEGSFPEVPGAVVTRTDRP